MLEFIKKTFLNGSAFLSSLISTPPLSCISMNKQDHKLLMLIVVNPYFILLVLQQANVVAAVTISMIHMQKYVFLML